MTQPSLCCTGVPYFAHQPKSSSCGTTVMMHFQVRDVGTTEKTP